MSKPRWVEVADKAATVLEAARDAEVGTGEKDATVREAHAWMQLACIYRDGNLPD